METTLPVSRLINVTVNLSPPGAQQQALNTLLILGSTVGIIDTVSRMREYTSIEEVGADFGGSAPEYLAAVLWFEQVPQPTSIFIGRWAKVDTHGKLIGGALSAAQQAMGVWTAIIDGGFSIDVDGVLVHLSGMNFSACATMNAVAAVIQAVLGSTATIVWNAQYSHFEITSPTTGASSSILFLTAPSSGTDISAMMLMASTSSGAYEVPGIAAETALSCVELFDQKFGQKWYAVMISEASSSDQVAVAGYIEAASTYHLLGVTSQEAGALNSGDVTTVGALLKLAGYDKTIVQWSSENAYAIASLLGRILTTDWTGNNTTITLMYKQEPGIVAESLTQPQVAALEANNYNVFVNYDNDTAIIEQGKTANGQFADTVIGIAALATTIQNDVYNLLYLSPSKIPQTDAGVHVITTTIEHTCGQFVDNGLLAPGTWNSAGFGDLKQGQFIPTGFYVYAPSVALQAEADRAARKAPPIQVAAKLAGAVHTVDVLVNVNS